MAASAEEEKERIDEWHRFFTEDGTQLISFIFFCIVYLCAIKKNEVTLHTINCLIICVFSNR